MFINESIRLIGFNFIKQNLCLLCVYVFDFMCVKNPSTSSGGHCEFKLVSGILLQNLCVNFITTCQSELVEDFFEYKRFCDKLRKTM